MKSLLFFWQRSLQDELARKIAGDVPLLIASYAVMIVFVGFTLGRVHWVKSRILVGLGGIATVIVSIIAALGFCNICGLIFSLISVQVIPFLMLGVGVNDMFIVVKVRKTFWLSPKKKVFFLTLNFEGFRACKRRQNEERSRKL